MDKKEIIEKIEMKKEFSQLPKADLLKAFGQFDKDYFSDEEKVKKTRDFLRKVFSGFSGQKLLVFKDRSAEEVLKKHLSTRERFEHYEEIYSRLLKNLPEKISVADLGCGVNGFSYEFLVNSISPPRSPDHPPQQGLKYKTSLKRRDVNYLGVEAVGQLVDLMKDYFDKEGLSKAGKAKAVHASLFELEKIKDLIGKEKKPRVIFLFKVIDSLEKFERNYTKTLLKELVPLADRVVVSFATQSWARRKKFFASRKWLIDFIRENFQYTDDFEIAGERYLVFEKK